MLTRIVEATSPEGNYGKFLLAQFDAEEWAYRSRVNTYHPQTLAQIIIMHQSSRRKLASRLGVSHTTLNRVVSGGSPRRELRAKIEQLVEEITPRGRPLLSSLGWSNAQPWAWVLDMQTGEGAYFLLTGIASADLNKHRIWVCPLFEPFLEWLYACVKENKPFSLDWIPPVVMVEAPLQTQGYRRGGDL